MILANTQRPRHPGAVAFCLECSCRIGNLGRQLRQLSCPARGFGEPLHLKAASGAGCVGGERAAAPSHAILENKVTWETNSQHRHGLLMFAVASVTAARHRQADRHFGR